MKRNTGGFTLVELMVVVAIIGILTSIAMPIYLNYVKQSKAQEATSNLIDMKTRAEQWFADNKTYVGYPCTTPANAKNFAYTCPSSDLTATTYQIVATGVANSPVSGWVYTINQDGVRTSSGIDGSSSTNCWLTKKNSSCT